MRGGRDERMGCNASWLRNIEAAPDCVEIVIGSRQFKASYRRLGSDEAIAVIAGYERRNRLIAPLVRAGFSWLLGWPYDSSDAARSRAAAEKPYIAFRPAAVSLSAARRAYWGNRSNS